MLFPIGSFPVAREGRIVPAPIAPIIMAAAPLLRELVGLVVDAIERSGDDDVPMEQIEAMEEAIEEKVDRVKELIAAERARRSTTP